MGVMRSLRAAGRAAGALVDDEDRQFLGMLLVWAFGLLAAAAVLAASAGLAVRVFEFVAG